VSDSVEARLKREAEFHDERFADDTRAPTDRFYTVARRAYDRYNDLVVEGAAGKKVLEYGCGPGSAAFGLAESGAEVHGIDISPVAIEMAQKTAAERGVAARCHFQVMNAEALTYADGSFDRICGSGILHHLDLDRGFREIARTLKPGGKAIFIEPLGHNPAINWYRRRTPEMRTSDEHPLVSRDLAAASKYFSKISPQFFNLSVLAAVPLQNTAIFRPIQKILDRVDDILLSPRSPLRWNAWLILLVLERDRTSPATP
jgi:ubiquinone/menaquinone biosynthesis C-methylase UbiE